ncbi:MAG TPA: ROK family protein [Stellaceae bacterium]|nr:ROK family protein [Stellaceae bacterium]
MDIRILAIDIGGTGLKASVLDRSGKMLVDRVRMDTPHPCSPEVMVDSLVRLVTPLSSFNRIAIGFPGVVRDNKVLTAPHFDTGQWVGFALADVLSNRLGGHPAKMINDAEMQGLPVISGKGLELVLTLGTGAGTGLFRDGEIMPHMELAHHPVQGRKTYNDYIGDEALKKIGKKRWNKRVAKVLGYLHELLHQDRLYVGGGNARHVAVELPPNTTVISNDAGITGGARLWVGESPAAKKPATTKKPAPPKPAAAKKPATAKKAVPQTQKSAASTPGKIATKKTAAAKTAAAKTATAKTATAKPGPATAKRGSPPKAGR